MAQQVFKITDATKVKLIGVNENKGNINSMTISNLHTDVTTVDLYLAAQVTLVESYGTTYSGSDTATVTKNVYNTTVTDRITNTGVLAAETEAASTSSVTLTVDTVDATADVLDEEIIYKSDGTIFGTCTAVNSTTEIVFSAGLDNAITNNDPLYVGKRYYIIKSLTIPVGQTLKLESNEVSFNNRIHSLYVKSTRAVDIIIN